MSYTKKIVCLANSRKMSGRCIAGKEIVSGQWIRPVSDRKDGEISEEEQMFSDGSYPQVLDIISIKLLKPLTHKYQQENHLIDNKAYWEKEGSKTWDNLEQIKDEPSELWLNGDSSSKGENDRIPYNEASKLNISLFLIYIQSMEINVNIEQYSNKRKIRALFTYNNSRYNFSITDPKVESYFLKKIDGKYCLNNVYACISIGEPLEGYCYKLVAGVITNPLF